MRLPAEFAPFTFRLKNGRKRTYRVLGGVLQSLREGKWCTASRGKGNKIARSTIRAALGAEMPPEQQSPEVVVVVEGRTIRRPANSKELELWKAPYSLAWDWGVQERAGYWRPLPARGALYAKALAVIRSQEALGKEAAAFEEMGRTPVGQSDGQASKILEG